MMTALNKKPAVSRTTAAYDMIMRNERGAIGYMLAWFMGVPLTVLVLIYVLRGFN